MASEMHVFLSKDPSVVGHIGFAVPRSISTACARPFAREAYHKHLQVANLRGVAMSQRWGMEMVVQKFCTILRAFSTRLDTALQLRDAAFVSLAWDDVYPRTGVETRTPVPCAPTPPSAPHPAFARASRPSSRRSRPVVTATI